MSIICVCVNFLPVHVYLSLDDVSFWLCALHWFENTFFSLDTVMTLSVHALKILLIAGEVLVVCFFIPNRHFLHQRLDVNCIRIKVKFASINERELLNCLTSKHVCPFATKRRTCIGSWTGRRPSDQLSVDFLCKSYYLKLNNIQIHRAPNTAVYTTLSVWGYVSEWSLSGKNNTKC